MSESNQIVDQLLEANPDWKRMHSRYDTAYSVLKFLASKFPKINIYISKERNDTTLMELMDFRYAGYNRLNPRILRGVEDEGHALRIILCPILDSILEECYKLLSRHYGTNIGDQAVIRTFGNKKMFDINGYDSMYLFGDGDKAYTYSDLENPSKDRALKRLQVKVKSGGDVWWKGLMDTFLLSKIPLRSSEWSLVALNGNAENSITAEIRLSLDDAISISKNS